MKIAIFHLGFFYSGGGEKLVLEEMRGLRRLGHEVDCFAPYVDWERCFPDVPEMREIRPLLPPPPQWLPMKDPLWVTLCCILVPLLCLRFRSYDVLLGANQPGPWFAYVLSKILRKPYVVYLAQALRLLHPRVIDLENGIRIREGDHRFLMALKSISGSLIGWADEVSTRRANCVLTNGEHVASWIREVYGVESQVCPAGCHPIPTTELDYGRRWNGTIRVDKQRISKPFILLTNRHSPMKRFEYALWAFKTIQRFAPQVSLVITGQETEYTDQLRYLARGMMIEPKVHFVGLVPEMKLSQLYRESAVYVYPSPEEDFGMGIVEAMAAGTPVVAWRNGGPTVTVVDRETGYLVEPYDTDAFAEKLLQLVTSPLLAERLGRSGHNRVQRLFSYAHHNMLLELALRSVVESPQLELPRRGLGPELAPEAILAIHQEIDSGV